MLSLFCVSLQAFGAPYIVAEVNEKKERFFGSDRFELMAHVIGMFDCSLNPVSKALCPL